MSSKTIAVISASGLVLAAIVTGIFSLFSAAGSSISTAGDGSPIIEGNKGSVSISVLPRESRDLNSQLETKVDE